MIAKNHRQVFNEINTRHISVNEIFAVMWNRYGETPVNFLGCAST